MPRSRDAKRTKKIKQLRNKFDVSKETNWLIECFETLTPKSLIVATWALAAGPLGAKACDIAEATGLTKQVCIKALDDLVDDELATSHDGRWFILLPDSDLQNMEPSNSETGTSSSFACFSSSSSSSDLSKEQIGSISPLILPRQSDLGKEGVGCNQKAKENTDLDAKSVPNSHATLAVTNLEDRIKKERPLDSKKLRPKKVNTHSNPENQEEAKRKLRRLSSPRKKFRADLVPKKPKTTNGNGGTRRDYRRNPSQHPDLNNWSQRDNPNNWLKLDWVGYWLHKYLNRYDVEDPHFVGQTVYRSMKRSKERNKGYLDAYWCVGIQITKLGDSSRGFSGDWQELKEYIDWLLDQYIIEADWLTGPVTAKQAFKVTNNHFVERFKVRDVKPKGAKKKGKGKRHHWGYDPNG
jgi:hypothetical protein